MDNQIKNILKNKKFLPSKKMGQNFLSDKNIISKIIDLSPDLSRYDAVIEIGPGLGAITEKLVYKTNKLICVELDKRLYSDLKTKFKNQKNIEIINNDFLEINLNELCKNYKNVIVFANIPYSITTPIIVKCLSCNLIKTCYLMVQKEVATKWVYSKTTNRNASTNIINYYFDVQKMFDIKNTCFVPAPKVDSSMVLLNKKTNQEYDVNFFKFMRPFFLAKRKKLINNLPPFITKQQILIELEKLGFDSNVRSEQLDYNQWYKLYKIFKNNNEN